MKNSKWMAFAAVALLTSTMAFAAPHEGGRHGGKFGGRRGHGDFGPRMAEKLGLSDAQKEQIRTLRKNFREDNKDFLESAKATFRDFRNARQANDTARIDALKPQLDANRERFRTMHQQLEQQIVSVFTPEQRAQYETLKAERKQRRSERRDDRRNEQH